MMGIKDWVLSQLANSLVSTRPLSGGDRFFEDERVGNELSIQGSTDTANLLPPPDAAVESRSYFVNQDIAPQSPPQEVVFENASHSHCRTKEKKLDVLSKIEMLQINFLRVVRRLGYSQADLVVAKVLYRIHLASMIRAGEHDLERVSSSSDKAKAMAAEKEATGISEVDVSFRVLVLGRTGVGKSSTINSILEQKKATTDAFRPATRHIQEIYGIVSGVKVSFIDTPGLLPSSPNTVGKNRKILLSVRKHIKKSRPDIVLYFERLDLINNNYSDLPLLKLVTEMFGPSIWFSTILVMTHSSSILPEGPNGYPLSYESYLGRCSELLQHYIHQAASDSKLRNPVVFVENHPKCKTNNRGDKILPNGQVWKSEFLLFCLCTKILGDVNTILELQDGIELGIPKSTRLPSLPHLLSAFLQHRMSIPSGADNELDDVSLSDLEEEDGYDQLPPIRILTKSQFKKLTNTQKQDYLDELDYRETLYLKKQLKEELVKRREERLSQGAGLAGDDISDNQEGPAEPVLLPDMSVPPSFDSDCPVHRYRFLITSEEWLARPVLDPHGWDHDVGFDGINLETTKKIKKNIFASVAGQISKDKQDFNIQSESRAAFVDPRGPTYSLGLDVQSSGKDLIYTLHGNTKLHTLKRNIAEGGLCMTSFGGNCYVGAKLQDSISVGNRVKFVMNAGRMGGLGKVAYGGSFGTTLRGKDYPVRNDKISLTMTVLSMNKETVLGGSMESDFRLGRGTKISINGNLNSQNMGKVSVKTSSSEHLELALIGLVSVFKILLRRRESENLSGERLSTG